MMNRSAMKKEMQGGKKTQGKSMPGGPLCGPGHTAKKPHKKMAMRGRK